MIAGFASTILFVFQDYSPTVVRPELVAAILL